ncbi:hypothetical protein DE4576_05408 [Mycobacterium marinum]|nr:hypothetical protein DE4576_05408 [Mycobacterium marinum]
MFVHHRTYLINSGSENGMMTIKPCAHAGILRALARENEHRFTGLA